MKEKRKQQQQQRQQKIKGRKDRGRSEAIVKGSELNDFVVYLS